MRLDGVLHLHRLEDDEHRAEVDEQTRRALRTQLLLDAIAEKEGGVPEKGNTGDAPAKKTAAKKTAAKKAPAKKAVKKAARKTTKKTAARKASAG